MQPEINPLKTSVVNVTDLALDSGSFYHVVPSKRMLLNHRHSDQGFITADGCLSNATCKGTLPLLITHADGERSILLLKDVECNPSFKMTLISVRLLAKKGATLIFGEVCWMKLPATV